ncbi:MAG TPA: tyrosine--tRNA ligase [Acidimicrobiales bacterium]|nr:tyrosine--tRNA ligase [Acidimicrobiales bacterium]
MGLFDELQWRGLVHDLTDPVVPEKLDAPGAITAYIGFDPSADSLHLGNLLQLCNLRRLQDAGHHVIALVGGATGMIGDPGGRSEERNLLSSDELAANLAGVRAQLEGFLPGATFVDNQDWLRGVSILDFLRDVGKHFTINQMVAKESVKARFEGRDQGISYTEFSYMLLQAADYLHLHDTYGCNLQLGASDQWGNIVTGIELVRKVRGHTVYGFTSPLVLRSDGAKFGKSVAGAVWLDGARTSPYGMYQFLVRSEDSVVGQYLRYFTWLPRPRIEELDARTAEAPERREAQRVLAQEVVALVHGKQEADRAEHASSVLFSEEIAALDEATLVDVFAEAPSTTLGREPVPLVDVLASTGLATSKSDARRHLQAGAVYVNNRKVADADGSVDPAVDALHGRYVVLRRGKASQHLLRFERS